MQSTLAFTGGRQLSEFVSTSTGYMNLTKLWKQIQKNENEGHPRHIWENSRRNDGNKGAERLSNWWTKTSVKLREKLKYKLK